MKILIVDDVVHFAKHTAMEMAKLGHETWMASSGRHAIDILEDHPDIDAIFCDEQLQDVSGVQLYHYLQMCRRKDDKGNLLEPPMFVLVSTEDLSETIRHAELEFPLYACLKPVEPERLKQLIGMETEEGHVIDTDEVLNTEKILLVDSDKYSLRILKKYFQHYGYTVLSVSSGSEALKRLRWGIKFSAVVCNLSLRDMTGVALLEQAQEFGGADAQLPPFTLIGERSAMDQIGSQQLLQFARVMSAPVTFEKLRDTVFHVVEDDTIKNRVRSCEYRHVLIVDDFAYNRAMLSQALKGAGYSVVEADNWNDALSIFDEDLHISAVLLDLDLGADSGVELFKMAQQINQTRTKLKAEMPAFLLMTERTESELPEGIAEEGFAEILYKPVNGHKVVDKLEKMIQKKMRKSGQISDEELHSSEVGKVKKQANNFTV